MDKNPRLSVSLSEDTMESFKRMADRKHTSVAAVVRD